MNEHSFIILIHKSPLMMDKKTRILQATEKLLAMYGFHGLSMQMVAREAGVAAGTIYRYFEDKDDLLHQLHDHILACVANKISQNVSDNMPLQQRFRTMWLNIWDMAIQDDAPLINRGQFDSLPKRENQEQRLLEKKLFAKVDQMFSDGKAAGLFKPLDNEILGTLSLEPCICLARKHVNGVYKVSDEVLDAAIEASWDAIVQH
ncbi:TetR/AcrR family transcriptional regulator [Photobacterium ganghwense]|uniref:TetR family transcriptional regulator n=2 Tax=Vibrionaceae TaxID=641 RepID=A0A0J1H2P4_9GAMM|nr:TetR family transcriptional regulator [Photobacterium ganghwense]MBV1842776.1 TetR/AcrR family transcriptional regulator [Photobacterium ganghwense]QSV14047.1 TetR/AcrR family transcriptional regulator [Photobacterium ganghwense]